MSNLSVVSSIVKNILLSPGPRGLHPQLQAGLLGQVHSYYSQAPSQTAVFGWSTIYHSSCLSHLESLSVFSVQFSLVTQSCLTLCDPMDYGMPGFPSIPNPCSLLRLMSIKLVMPSNHLILCSPLLFLPSILPWGSFQKSQFFASGGHSIGVSASASVLPMNIQDWFPFGLTDLILHSKELSSLLQNHSSESSIPRCSAFFTLQLSHPYMTSGKTIALTIWIFVGKVMSLLFNTLSRFAISFLPRSKCLLISWLQSLPGEPINPSFKLVCLR